MKILLIRHGKTQGNMEKRYIGRTDEPLCQSGIDELRLVGNRPYADMVISSPMKRCLQTAEILFGRTDIVVPELAECDFGNFENKTYEQLKNDTDYLNWLDCGGKIPFPNGEDPFAFRRRCCDAFNLAVLANRNKNTLAFVVHGGVIMALLEKFADIEFYSIQPKNGEIITVGVLFENDSFKLWCI